MVGQPAGQFAKKRRRQPIRRRNNYNINLAKANFGSLFYYVRFCLVSFMILKIKMAPKDISLVEAFRR